MRGSVGSHASYGPVFDRFLALSLQTVLTTTVASVTA